MKLFRNLIPSKVYREGRTGIEFPQELAGLKRGEIHPYSAHDSEGVAIAYGIREETSATIYVFSRIGIKVSHDGVSEVVDAELDEAMKAVRELEERGLYSSLKEYTALPECLGTSAGNQSWAKAAFTARTEGTFIISLLYLTGFRGYFIKLRLTTNSPEDKHLTMFPSALGDLLNTSR